MANKTDGQQIERAVVAADGTITIPHSGAELQSVDVADVDLLLSFSNGIFVVIPNGALDAISDSLHKVVFLGNEDGSSEATDLGNDHLGTLGDLFKMVGTTSLAKAGSLRVVSENVDAPEEQGYGYTRPDTFELSEDISTPEHDQLSGGKAPGNGALIPTEELLAPVSADPVVLNPLPSPPWTPPKKATYTEPTITLDPNVTDDDIVNIAEAAGDVAITGVLGGTAIIGDTVTLTVNGTTYTGQVQVDMTFSIDVAGADLVADADKTIDASITSLNKTATDFDDYSIDLTPPVPTITLNDITADNIINLAEAGGDVTISGSVDGEVQAGDTVTLTVNGIDSTGLVDDTNSFRIDVAGSDLMADLDTTIDANISTNDLAGNPGSADTSKGYTIDSSALEPKIVLDSNIASDNIINIVEAGGDVAITGTVADAAQVGDTVTLTVNGVDSIGLVRDNNTFSINVRGSDLVADIDQTIDASITTINGAGNPGTGTTTAGYSVDTVRPTATIDVDDASLIAGENSLVTITFSEAVTGFDNTVLAPIENGTLSDVSSADGGITWTAILTPDAPIEDSTNIITLYNSGVTDLAGNIGNGTSVSNNYAIDNVSPTVLDVTVSDDILTDADTGTGKLDITVKFSEAMDSSVSPTLIFSTDVSASIVNGAGVWSNGDATYTVTYDVVDVDIDLVNISVDVIGAQDASGNVQQDYAATGEFSIDTLNPTVIITTDNTDGVVSDADIVVNYTLTFSEAVNSITDLDLDITGGMLTGGPTLAADGLTASFAVTATDSSTADLTVMVKDSILDLNDNPLLISADSTNTLPVDTFTLTVDIAEDNADGVVSDIDNVVNYTLTFSDKIVSITDLDLDITGGTLNPGSLSLAADGITATFSVTATDDSTADLSVTLNNSIEDWLGHPLVTANNTLAVDTLNPTVIITTDNIDDTVSDVDKVVNYTLTFSEEVSSITKDDLTITGGEELTVDPILAADGLSATFTVTAPDNTTGNLSVTVNDSILDLNGNHLVPENSTLPIDTVNPWVTLVTSYDLMVTDADAGGTLDIVVTFSEAMNTSVAPTLIFGGDVSSSLVKINEEWYTHDTRYLATYSIIDVNIELADITIDAIGGQDASGNTQLDYAPKAEFSIDTLALTANLSEDNADGIVSDVDNPVNYILTFSEEVASIADTDLTITGGALDSGSLVLAAGGLSASFSVTATDNSVADLTVTVNNSILDLRGGQLVPVGNSLAVDTLNPTVIINTSNIDGTVSDMDNPVNYTLTFSEEVRSIAASDLSITGGTLTIDPVLAADGLSATFTVTATNESTTALSVNVNDSILDLNGNHLVPDSSTLTVNTVDPLTDFVSSLYNSPDFKVTGGSGVPEGSYVVGATAADHALASSPAGQASRGRIDGTSGNDIIDHNPAFSADSTKWSKALHIDFDLFIDLTTIELVVDPTISGLPPGFDIVDPRFTMTTDGQKVFWTFNPDTPSSTDLLTNGLDLNIVYDVTDSGGPVDFNVLVNVSGTDGVQVFNQANGNLISNTLDFSWREATTEADFDLTVAGNQVMVLPRDGMGLDIYAGDGDDTVNSGAGDDVIYGGAGVDSIDAGAGNDLLVGGADADSLEGGAGNDTASYTGSLTDVSASLATGLGSGGDAAGDQYFNIENLTGGDGNDNLTGDANTNILSGGTGDDSLSGGAGDDILIGGIGGDMLDGGSDLITGDTASYAGSVADVSASLATGTGSGGDAAGDLYFNIENLTGGAGNDTLSGDINSNILSGGAGDDILIGGLGSDILDGGIGAGDTVSYTSSGTAIDASLVTNNGSDGTDTDTFIDIENLIGSSYGDTLSGDGNDNVLTGGAGADVLNGGAGNDTASYADAGARVVASLTSNFWPLQSGDAQGDSFNSIENLTGSDHDDGLVGDSSANILSGGAGDDSLNGLGGNDSLDGGLGNDSIYVSSDPGDLPNSVDGGDGVDTLVLQGLVDGGSYDLTALANVTDNIETLDIRDGVGTEISVTGLDVQSMVDGGTSSLLVIMADSGDSLNLTALGTAGVDYTVTPIAAGTEYTIITGDLATIQWHIA